MWSSSLVVPQHLLRIPASQPDKQGLRVGGLSQVMRLLCRDTPTATGTWRLLDLGRGGKNTTGVLILWGGNKAEEGRALKLT